MNNVLCAMNRVQRHRGPDFQGTYWNEAHGVGLAHTRLAVLDLSEPASQPMHSKDGQLSIVFNGEIYNWKSLRYDLERRGIRTYTNSDTEVLLGLYRIHGKGMLCLLRGMFSFAIYDHVQNTLFCARDRIGKKPFVYAETAHGFVFGSEIPAVLCAPGCDVRLDVSAIACMLLHNIRHIVEPRTVYAGLRKLRPGHAMTVKDGKVDRIWRYWEPTANPSAGAPQHLRETLEEAVCLRVQADVPVGALLSGGVDSTSIVHLMKQYMREPVHTYAFGVDAKDEDLRRARYAAKLLGTHHKEFYFDPEGQYEIFKRTLKTYGEPIMLLPLIHAYELSKAVREDGIKVVLNGNGADELFYGYTGHLKTARITMLVNIIAWIRHFMPEREGSVASVLLAEPGKRKSSFYEYKARKLWPDIFRPEAVDVLVNYVSEELEYWGELVPNKDFIDESNYLSLLLENAHSLTIASDLPGMMASIEVRSPFLDQEVVSEAMGIHFSLKVKGPKDGSGLKHILRKAVEDLVPREIMRAPKRGFGMGVQEKDVLLGPWMQYAEEVFCDYPDLNAIDSGKVAKMWKRAMQQQSGEWSLLAKLFAIGIWLREG